MIAGRKSLGKGAWLLDGGANWWHRWVWYEAEKVFFLVGKVNAFCECFIKWLCSVERNELCSLSQSYRNARARTTWREYLKPCKKWQECLCFSHQTPPLSCGQSSKACPEVRTEFTAFKHQRHGGKIQVDRLTTVQSTTKFGLVFFSTLEYLVTDRSRDWQKQD